MASMSTSSKTSTPQANVKPSRPPTAFEQRVYSATSAIPAGRVSTYGEVAKLLKSSPRAVGQALRRNPFAPRVPCHRVIAASGSLGGFSGTWGKTPETEKKLRMLVDEGVKAESGGGGGKSKVKQQQQQLTTLTAKFSAEAVMSAAELAEALGEKEKSASEKKKR